MAGSGLTGLLRNLQSWDCRRGDSIRYEVAGTTIFCGRDSWTLYREGKHLSIESTYGIIRYTYYCDPIYPELEVHFGEYGARVLIDGYPVCGNRGGIIDSYDQFIDRIKEWFISIGLPIV